MLRPWVTVGFWKGFGVSYEAILALHFLSLFAWARLGWVAFGPLGSAAGLGIASTDLIHSWNYTVLSEPLAISGLALLGAETLAAGRGGGWWRNLSWGAAVLLTTTRVATATLCIPAAIALAVRRYPQKFFYWPILFAGLAAAIPIWQQHRLPFHELQQSANTALFRVAEVPSLQKWMVDRGMPWPIPDRWYRIQYPNLDDMRATGYPELADYITHEFSTPYKTFLLSHPEYTLRDALCKGVSTPPATLYPGHGILPLDAPLRQLRESFDYFSILPAALLTAPWAGVNMLILPVLSYHVNINEFERMNAVLWAWQWITCFVMVRIALDAGSAFCRRVRAWWG